MSKLPERIRIKDIARLADVSVGTVDRVIHGRAGVSEASRKRVEEILAQLDYQPNKYASALASNKKYTIACLLPMHEEGEYWTAVEKGIHEAAAAFSDFQVSIRLRYYDPYDYRSFLSEGDEALKDAPDGVIFAPTAEHCTRLFTDRLNAAAIPYIYIDSNLREVPALAFFGQHSHQSGYFAARMLMMMAGKPDELVIFRKINEGIVGSNQQENREKGFRQYMQEHHPDCRILELDLYVKKPEEDFSRIETFLAEHPAVRCGITFNSKVYIVGEYLQSRGIGDFNLLGYDLLERNVQSLKAGYVTFLIAQQPELQGYHSVEAFCNHLIFKKEVAPVNYMPIDLIAKETIDYYMKFQQ
ncbi:MAG: substrate-binding domain-containing protein [Bacteroidaceae bacterium]